AKAKICGKIHGEVLCKADPSARSRAGRRYIAGVCHYCSRGRADRWSVGKIVKERWQRETRRDRQERVCRYWTASVGLRFIRGRKRKTILVICVPHRHRWAAAHSFIGSDPNVEYSDRRIPQSIAPLEIVGIGIFLEHLDRGYVVRIRTGAKIDRAIRSFQTEDEPLLLTFSRNVRGKILLNAKGNNRSDANERDRNNPYTNRGSETNGRASVNAR